MLLRMIFHIGQKWAIHIDISLLRVGSHKTFQQNVVKADKFRSAHELLNRSRDRHMFNMGIPILVRLHIYIDIETAPGSFGWSRTPLIWILHWWSWHRYGLFSIHTPNSSLTPGKCSWKTCIDVSSRSWYIQSGIRLAIEKEALRNLYSV